MKLLEPVTLGRHRLRNRAVMAPLTRCRADADGVPNSLLVEHYRQRASAGLIISEGTWINPMGRGYGFTPGIYSEEQVEGWKKVTAAVHERGGLIFCQLWHVGRVSHPQLLPQQQTPVSSSAVAVDGICQIGEENFSYPSPRSLEISEISVIVEQYVTAARKAIEAGFDGVEIHAGNDYLLDQFIKDSINQRTDSYGGTIANRIRFTVEVCTAVAEAIGADRTGLRLSPTGTLTAEMDSTPAETFAALVESISPLQLAYLHLLERFPGRTEEDERQVEITANLKTLFNGPVLCNGGYFTDSAEKHLVENGADAIVFGRPFIANPDLVERIEAGEELATPNEDTFYVQGAAGYNDYPSLT